MPYVEGLAKRYNAVDGDFLRRHQGKDMLKYYTNKTLSRLTKDDLGSVNEGHYFRSAAEMARVFAYYPDALKNTVDIAAQCQIDLERKQWHFAHFPTKKPLRLLTHLCVQG